ncbi:LuxR C-terminal-related transcriptional regulator [Streptomyces sp. NPDC059122]|uniref:LuxR C-terminal-related transcriptional regulator n=1 Tax=Streptomyces sp. NPDC059122 TaxID=3346732 RepID=UPI003696E12B
MVERGQGLRSSGSPIDVRGPAFSAAEQMGITRRLRAARTEVTELNFVDASGRRVGRIPTQARRGDSVELPRFDLATILFEAAREEAEFLFGDSIATLHQDAGGVDVTFEHAPPRRFDLVIGADGLHSRTRQLAFGPEVAYVRHMGVWVATMPADDLNLDRHKVLLHNSPGRAVALHPCRGKAMAAFLYRGPGDESFDHRDTADHKRRLIDAYSGAGWRVPELLQRIRDVDDLYFDSVSQVRLDRWCAPLAEGASGAQVPEGRPTATTRQRPNRSDPPSGTTPSSGGGSCASMSSRPCGSPCAPGTGPRPLPLAAASADLGRALLTAGDAAAVPALTRAYEVHARVGADFEADRVRADLERATTRSGRRTGGLRPRPGQGWDALTASERKVARLIAAGHTNRLAAAALLVSPHTVNTHLASIFRKLSVHSRVRLARIVLAEGDPGTATAD